jgi:hypothetical protein
LHVWLGSFVERVTWALNVFWPVDMNNPVLSAWYRRVWNRLYLDIRHGSPGYSRRQSFPFGGIFFGPGRRNVWRDVLGFSRYYGHFVFRSIFMKRKLI